MEKQPKAKSSSLRRVYLETSFISYLASALQGRHSSDVNTAHRQLSSLSWWAHRRQQCVYGCNYLLTWNFKHIANALLQPALNQIIQSYGYQPTIICTPEQLLIGNRDL